MPRLLRKRKGIKSENWKIVTIPNILTFARVSLVPFLVLSFFVSGKAGTVLTLTLFLTASLTDYADGYIARRFQQVSSFGAFWTLLPIKFLLQQRCS